MIALTIALPVDTAFFVAGEADHVLNQARKLRRAAEIPDR
jgi:hypothetical protein